MLPLDLHVLSLSLAFILSQDQTLHCTLFLFIRLSLNSSFIVVSFKLKFESWNLKVNSNHSQFLWRWYFFTLYLYYIFVVSDFQRIAVFSFSGNLSRLRMQRYNIFLKYQIICNKKFQLFFFRLIISDIIFKLSQKYMLYNMIFCIFSLFLDIF